MDDLHGKRGFRQVQPDPETRQRELGQNPTLRVLTGMVAAIPLEEASCYADIHADEDYLCPNAE